MKRIRPVVLGVALVLAASGSARGHEGEHGDPELLGHWRAQVHLLFQWAHLAAFGLWVGGVLAASRLPRLGLGPLLFGSWGLFLVSLATGTYNMEFSAATPDAPDILSLPGLSRRWPFGDAYIVLVGVKQALLLLAVLWTAAVTVIYLRASQERDHGRLRTGFLAGAAAIGLALAAVTSLVLVLHEAIDLAPTPLHSLGGVVGRLGPDELARADRARGTAPAPYDTDTFALAAGLRLFAVPRAAGDALARFGHLVGFALWLGGNAAGLLVPMGDVRRVLPLLWLGLAIQFATGAYQMISWTPFAVVPYPWRLATMSDFRFGHTYTLLLGVKLALVVAALLVTVSQTMFARRGPGAGGARASLRFCAVLNLGVGLVLAYVAVALLLVHEGVDHAL